MNEPTSGKQNLHLNYHPGNKYANFQGLCLLHQDSALVCHSKTSSNDTDWIPQVKVLLKHTKMFCFSGSLSRKKKKGLHHVHCWLVVFTYFLSERDLLDCSTQTVLSCSVSCSQPRTSFPSLYLFKTAATNKRIASYSQNKQFKISF